MLKKISRYVLPLLFCLTLATPAFGQGIKNASGPLNSIAAKAGTTDSDITLIIGNVINAVLSILGIIFFVLMVYAGYMWMTAQGDESKVDKAKDIIQATIIGLIVTVSAYAISVFVTSRFENTPAATSPITAPTP